MRARMTVKRLEKLHSSLLALHREQLDHWAGAELEAVRAAERVTNHRAQLQLFSQLDVSRLQIAHQLPDIKDQLLHKLSSVTREHEAKLTEYYDTFAAHSKAIQELSSSCMAEASSVTSSTSSVTSLWYEPRPGKLSLAATLEQCYSLSRLYRLTMML